MTFQVSNRNYKGTEFETIKKRLSEKYTIAHDELSIAYYDYWKNEKSHAWNGYDVQATKNESKVLFDKLHGLIQMKFDTAIYTANEKEDVTDQALKNRYELIVEDETLKENIPKHEFYQRQIDRLKQEGIECPLL
ncbi:hypothetical protein KA005_02300 [bacterium]|nr:hypothetical protein [bacterium]